MELEPVDFIQIAGDHGLPGMVIDDVMAQKRALHCRSVWEEREKQWKHMKIKKRDTDGCMDFKCSVVPIFSTKSRLMLCPMTRWVCSFPIDEQYTWDELGLRGVSIDRPMFYCELRAAKMKDMKRRYAQKKKGVKKHSVA